MKEMEQINRRTWADPWSVFDYGRITGYMDAGEKTAIGLGASRSGVDRRVLDIGIGGGRTAAILGDLGASYIGIDYTPGQVAKARRNHPKLRFEHMDARDLSAFADASFDFVMFSCNGIDSVDPDGRAAVLKEVWRVLAPGGAFVFSSFHRDWVHFSDHQSPKSIIWTANPVKLGVRVFRHVKGGIVSSIHIRRFLPLEHKDADHAVLLHWSHDFGIMVYATTAGRMRRQLATAGFAEPVIFIAPDGSRIDGEVSPETEYFHMVAFKPA